MLWRATVSCCVALVSCAVQVKMVNKEFMVSNKYAAYSFHKIQA